MQNGVRQAGEWARIARGDGIAKEGAKVEGSRSKITTTSFNLIRVFSEQL